MQKTANRLQRRIAHIFAYMCLRWRATTNIHEWIHKAHCSTVALGYEVKFTSRPILMCVNLG